jgi:replication-associated recombination protein RarA
MILYTKNGYEFYSISSAMQKAIRRNDARLAVFFALELFHSNYAAYVWKRLFTISAEDCAGFVTQEIEALWQGYQLVNQNQKGDPKGRIFISKAVLLLCAWEKSRDADHAQCLVYDKRMNLTEAELTHYLDAEKDQNIPIPDYAYDVHTRQGKKMGKTKAEFFRDEQAALEPKRPGLFDDLPDLI